jgi:hypothetical protein
MTARFETLAEFTLSLPEGELRGGAAIPRSLEEGPEGPVSKGGENSSLLGLESAP